MQHNERMQDSLTIKNLVIEQAMRASSDELDVIYFLNIDGPSKEAMAALGRFLSNNSLPLTPGCPILAWLRGTPLDPNWRDHQPVVPGSLWDNLTFLKAIYGEETANNGYEELEKLRSKEMQF